MTKRKRILFFDYLRIMAAFSVIIIHCVCITWDTLSVPSGSWMVANFYECISRWCVPIFVMMSGALFLSRDIDIKTIFKKYVLKLMIAFAVWSLIYLIPSGWNVSDFITGHYHMWFLPMIIGLYLITPLLKKILESRELTRYLLVLSLVFSILIPQVIDILASIPHARINSWGSSLATIYAYTGLSGLRYVGYFVLGYVLTNYNISRKLKKWIYAGGIIGTIVIFVGTLLISLPRGTAITIFYKPDASLSVFLQSIAVFVFAKEHMNRPIKCTNIITNISECSLGIYLSHALFIELILTRIQLFTSCGWPLIYTIPLGATICFLSGWALTFILKKIPIVGKYLV